MENSQRLGPAPKEPLRRKQLDYDWRWVRRALPRVEIDYLSITTSPLRWHEVEQVKKANGLISSWINSQDHVTFINVFPATLGEDGRPKPELFLADRLHMNAQGCAIWASMIEPYLK